MTKEKLEKVQNNNKLPISVEEEYQFNNQMFQISDVKDNYINTEVEIVDYVEETEEEPIEKQYELFLFESENKIFSKSTFNEEDQIRLKFSFTNTLEDLKIQLNDKVYDLRSLDSQKTFLPGSIPQNVFVICEYKKEIIEETTTTIEETIDGDGETIPEEKDEIVQKEVFFFEIKYIENFNCSLQENNYNIYYNTIISSFKDFEKKYSRNVLDCEYKFYIDSITNGSILLPLNDVRTIEKCCYLTLQEKQPETSNGEEDNDETNNVNNNEKEYEIVEKEISPDYFTVYKAGQYDEQRLIQVSEDFKNPEDILNDGSAESEMPFVFYFTVGFENNVLPADLKLAFMNDIQFKIMNRGSDIISINDRSAVTTDFVKTKFKNYKYWEI